MPKPKLSVVVPCFNEERTIGKLLRTVRGIDWKDLEVIVVDDASTDRSRELLQGELASLVDQLILQPSNKGKGAALRAGFAVASGELVIVQDADLEYDPNEIPRLALPILQGKADVVYGSRFMGSGPHRVLYYWHSVGNKFLTTLSNMTTNLNLTDMETCYKLFRREVIQSITLSENRFGFEPEVTAKVARLGVRVYEMGITYSGRTYQEGKKIGWKDGLQAVYCIIKYGFGRR